MGQAEGYFWTGMGLKSTQAAAVEPLQEAFQPGLGLFRLAEGL